MTKSSIDDNWAMEIHFEPFFEAAMTDEADKRQRLDLLLSVQILMAEAAPNMLHVSRRMRAM